jgi:hypothetical protein
MEFNSAEWQDCFENFLEELRKATKDVMVANITTMK